MIFAALRFLDFWVFRCRWQRLCEWVVDREPDGVLRLPPSADEYAARWEEPR